MPQDATTTCNRCKHYYITHDVGFPYGCRAMGFKSRRQPILDVLDATRNGCQSFQAKPLGMKPQGE